MDGQTASDHAQHHPRHLHGPKKSPDSDGPWGTRGNREDNSCGAVQLLHGGCGHGFSHRTVKWWRRTFYHLLEVAIVNSYILYMQQAGVTIDHETFRVKLAVQLLQQGGTSLPGPSSHPPPVARLVERHFLERIPPRATGAPSQLECVVCSFTRGRGRKTTTFRCKQCHLALCVVPCFELYHTKKDPKRYL